MVFFELHTYMCMFLTKPNEMTFYVSEESFLKKTPHLILILNFIQLYCISLYSDDFIN